MSVDKKIFKKGASDYYWSSRFLPKGMRDDVFKLYSFVRTARDATADPKAFDYLEHRWATIQEGLSDRKVPTPLDDSVAEHAMANMAYLVHRHNFDPDWTAAFLKSMRWDLQKHEYRSLKDTLAYMYGAAEVIGLMLGRMTGLPEESQKAARLQARALRYNTFLRDIASDHAAGRSYFPSNDIKKYGLKNLSEAEARSKPGMFADFMHAELLRYEQWQSEASLGFAHIPKRLRVPLETLVDRHSMIAQLLKYDPLTVYEQPSKSPRRSVVREAIRRTISR